MSLPILFGNIFSRQNNTHLLLIITLILSTLLLNLSCFDLEEEQAESNRQRWLSRIRLSDFNANANAKLRQQIARLSDRDDKFANGRSVVLRSPKMLFLQQRQSPRNLGQSQAKAALTNYIVNNLNQDDSFEREQRDKTTGQRQLAYLVSPFSEQVLEVGQQLAAGGTIAPNSILEDRYKLLNEDLWEPLLVKSSSIEISNQLDDECRTIRSNLRLEKDDIDKVTGRIVRTCKGLVQVNKCEGSCISTVQPSIKSPGGFIKECNCCNEGSFKRVQVRLVECYLDNQRIDGNNEDGHSKSYMDIEVEEPTECQCRRCASLL